VQYDLYYSAGSANLVVRMVLEELGLAYADIEVASRTVNRDARFTAMNPRGLVPVLVDHEAGVTLHETGAILLYLADRHGRLAPPSAQPQPRAALLKWLFSLSNGLHADLIYRYYSDRQVGVMAATAPFFAINREKVLRHLTILDEAIGAESDFLLPWGLSICDYYCGCLLRWAQLYPIDNPALQPGDLAAHLHATRALAGLQQRPAVRTAFARERIAGPGFVGPGLQR